MDIVRIHMYAHNHLKFTAVRRLLGLSRRLFESAYVPELSEVRWYFSLAAGVVHIHMNAQKYIKFTTVWRGLGLSFKLF